MLNVLKEWKNGGLMESDEHELSNLRTNRTEMPANFLYPDKWDRFIQSYLTRGTRTVDDYEIKMKEIQQIILERFIKARNGEDKEEEIKSRNDLLEWLVAYDFSFARIRARKMLWAIENQNFGHDAMMSTIIPVDDLTKNLESGDKLSSKSLVKAIYLYQPPRDFECYLIKYLRGAIYQAKSEFYHPGTARNAAINYCRVLSQYNRRYGMDPVDDEELARFAGKKVQTIKNWRDAYSTKDMHYFGHSDDEENEDNQNDKVSFGFWKKSPEDPESIIQRKEEDESRKEFLASVREFFQTRFTQNEKKVWYAIFFEEKDFKEIYSQYPSLRSVANCRKIYSRAQIKMKKELGEKWLNLLNS